MKNNKWLLAIAVLALSSTLAFAGPRGAGEGRMGHAGNGHAGMNHEGMGPGMGHEQMVTHLTKMLDLTEAQQAQVKQLNDTFHEQNKAFFESSQKLMQEFRTAKRANDTAKLESLKPAMDAQRTQMQQLHETHKKQISSVLTPEQLKKWEAFQAERGEHKGMRGKGHGEMQGMGCAHGEPKN